MASSIFGKTGGSSMLEQAAGAMRSFGATDATMRMLYQSNHQVRQMVDQYRGQPIDDLLRQRGIDPDTARRLLGIR